MRYLNYLNISFFDYFMYDFHNLYAIEKAHKPIEKRTYLSM